MTRLRVALAALIAGTAAALITMTVQASSPVQGAGEIAWHYDGTTVTWNTHDFRPGQWAHFDIHYADGHAPFYSTMTLDTPGYAVPDAPSLAGCGWQHWIVYTGDGHPYRYWPIPSPPSASVLARGSLYVCPGGAA